MDVNKRAALIAAIRAQPDSDADPAPVVSLEDFFVGNDDQGSIGCNLVDHPGVDVFFGCLRAVRRRADVQDVVVEIHEVDEADLTLWPYSERVYVLTSLGQGRVAELIERLQPSEVSEGWFAGQPANAQNPKSNHRVIAAWWD
jgi:hypothetical protein